MADRTTITVRTETKRTLDRERGDLPWDVFLRNLIQSNSEGELTEDHIDDIAAATARRTVEELEVTLR